MDGLIVRRHRREPLELQLTAMIDIFSMIVIFLIMGSIFGGGDIVMPAGVSLPKSSSREISASAPTLAIVGGQVSVSIVPGAIFAISKFRPAEGTRDPEIASLAATLKGFVGRIPAKDRMGGVFLNVVSDRSSPYEDVFDALRLFRESGFNTLLFVATAEGGAGK